MTNIHIISNFIDEQDSGTLISEQEHPSQINPYPEYYSSRFGGTSFPYNKTVMDILIKYGNEANEVHKRNNPHIGNSLYVYKAFGSHWTSGSSGGVHIDGQDPEPWIEWSTVVYLNDDFDGGKIFFPRQKFEYAPDKYSAVFFPGDDPEYAHGISEITSGHRYTMLFMHTTDIKHADPEFLKAVQTNAV